MVVVCVDCGLPIDAEIPFRSADGPACQSCIERPADTAMTIGVWRAPFVALLPALGSLASVLAWHSDLFRADIQVVLAFCGLLSFASLGESLRQLSQWAAVRSLPEALRLSEHAVLLGTAGLTASLSLAGLLLAAYGILYPVFS